MRYLCLIISLLVLPFSFSFAQQKSEALTIYTTSLYGYVQEELYPMIAESLFDVEEAPTVDDFIALAKKIDQQVKDHLKGQETSLNVSDISEAVAMRKALLVQLSEAYMERAEELSAEEKSAFFQQYLVQLGILEDLTNLNDDLSRSLMMALHYSLEIPFGMPNTRVEEFILSREEPMRESLKAAMVMNEMVMLSGGYEVSERLVKQFVAEYPQSVHLPNMMEDLKGLERLRTGAQVTDFEFKDLTGSTVRLSDYQDKIIYLDLWASWCGPCIQTFKTKTPDFEKKLVGLDDIVLMYVSVDEKEESWKNYLDKNPMNGVHLFAGQGFEAEIMRYFKVWGIPRYLILGKGNKILQVNAPRPGDEAYEALIEIGEGTE